MIVSTPQLPELAGTVAMVDGGFDPLHHGHIAYFRAASELGAPLLCNLAPDAWIAAKHPPLLTQSERATVIDAIRFVTYVHPANSSTAEVLAALRPKFYIKGHDWRGRLPAAEVELCASQGIEIVFLDTVIDSSTAVLKRYEEASRVRV
jgi:cytidyltransferase-like protein